MTDRELLEKVMKALEPFANEALRYDPDEGDDGDTAWDSDFPIGVYRAARTAHQQIKERLEKP